MLGPGLAPEAESYVPPQSWAYNPKIKGKHTYDPERAKKLLDEMGWRSGADGIRVKDGQRLSFENGCMPTPSLLHDKFRGA